MQTLVVVRVLTPPPVSVIKGQVNHCMEAFDLHAYLLAVFRQQGCELVDDHPQGQGVVCRRVVNLLTLVLNPTKVLADHP
jgi:hypothetical protein